MLHNKFVTLVYLKNTKWIKTTTPLKKINHITIDYNDFTIFYSREFPRISNHNLKSRIEIKNNNLLFIKKIQSNYSKSPDGRGIIEKPGFNKHIIQNAIFNKIKFLLAFLEILQKPFLCL